MRTGDRFLFPFALVGLTLASAATAQLGWYDARLPTHRNGAAMVFDPVANRMLMFGGVSNGAVLAATATWSGGELVLLPVGAQPSPRYETVLAYDAGRRCAVLFGGAGPDNSVYYGDTWLFQDGSWRSVSVTPSPPVRGGHALAYDAARGRTVLFGGHRVVSPQLDDTWEWDGQAWTQRNVSVHPAASYQHTMAYSPATQRVMYFGGASGRETWEWDGTGWTRLPATVGPTTSDIATMAWDEARAQMLLVQNTSLNQVLLWKWTGTDWVVVPTAHTPSSRFAAVAYDRVRGGLRLFGGVSTSELSDTWLWDGTDWGRIAAGVHPEFWVSALSHDPVRDRVVLLCGNAGAPGGHAGATWEWDGRRWVDVAPAAPPVFRLGAAMAYDAARAKQVLFGGFSAGKALADTWSWDGSAWTQLQPVGAPSARRYHAMAFDVVRQRVLLFGGEDATGARLADTWEWDGVTWTQLLLATGPSARSGHGMACDLWRARTVLFGGSPGGSETWEWGGFTWTQRTPPTSPPGRAGHAMAFDFLRGRTVISGSGYPGGSAGSDTWEWDGSTWVRTAGAVLPDSARMAFSAAARACVAVGAGGLFATPATRLYGDLVSAERLAYDQPCAGSRGPLTLSPLAWPRYGASGFALDVWNAPPSQTSALLLASYPVRIVLPGTCLLLVDPSTTFAQVAGQSSGSGFASFALPIPPNPALRGTTVFTQGVVLDPGAAVLPLVTSNGIALRVGDV